jgi:hypothetical protein
LRRAIVARSNTTKFRIQAEWDADAGMWVATSEDVRGLATEAPTVEALLDKLRVIVPELLELNGQLSPADGKPTEVPFELVATAQATARLSSAA